MGIVTKAAGGGVVGLSSYISYRFYRHKQDPVSEPGPFRSFYTLIAPALFKAFDAEQAHKATLAFGKAIQLLPLPPPAAKHDSLKQKVFGLEFSAPAGVAPGFDKNAELIPLMDSGLMSIGFVEVGSVTGRKSEGNPQPRCFRVPLDKAVINRMGLNNDGASRISETLARESGKRRGVVLGVNIAKTHDPKIVDEGALQDFEDSFRAVAKYADYVTINISCPNTKEGKTFEDPDALKGLLDKLLPVRDEVRPGLPVLLKLAPPPAVGADNHDDVLNAAEHLAQIAKDRGVQGFVCTNTASDRANLDTSPYLLKEIGNGGLSGEPIFERSQALIKRVYKATNGELPIIGVGGISSPERAYQAIKSGASLVEVYTGMVYEGPTLFGDINRGIEVLLKRDGYSNISEAIGKDA